VTPRFDECAGAPRLTTIYQPPPTSTQCSNRSSACYSSSRTAPPTNRPAIFIAGLRRPATASSATCRQPPSDVRADLSVRLARDSFETPAGIHELDLSHHEEDFRFALMRSMHRASIRAIPLDDHSINGYQRFCYELKRGAGQKASDSLVTALRSKKAIAPLRSFVAEPLRCVRMFLASATPPQRAADRRQGPTAPPATVHFLSHACANITTKNLPPGSTYSAKALARSGRPCASPGGLPRDAQMPRSRRIRRRESSLPND